MRRRVWCGGAVPSGCKWSRIGTGSGQGGRDGVKVERREEIQRCRRVNDGSSAMNGCAADIKLMVDRIVAWFA